MFRTMFASFRATSDWMVEKMSGMDGILVRA
jgi:hypothetical protein